MTNNFKEEFIGYMIKTLEGGYVNDPHDPGGETKYGISKRSYPHIDIPNLTLEEAIKIYYKDYWNKAGCDNLNPSLAIAVFDFAVNAGVKRSVSKLREAFKIISDIEPPAKFTSNEYELLNSLEAEAFDTFEHLRKKFYRDLNKPIYIKGWLNRVDKVKKWKETNLA